MPWTAGRPPSRLRGGLFDLLGETAQSLFTTLFPSDCRLCRLPLVKVSRLPVCDPCLEAMLPAQGPGCHRCGERLLRPPGAPPPDDDLLCPLCRRAAPPFEKALAYGSYEGGLRELLHLLKYEQVRPAGAVLGRMLAEVLHAVLAEMDPPPPLPPLLVPVPLHTQKLRQRGFNQAEQIARAALKLRPLALELQLGVLRRQRATRSQTGLTRHQRRANVRGAFAVEQPAAVAGRCVILVDDVFTTGTTLSECARVLRRAGAQRVYVATVARVLKAEAAGSMLSAAPETESHRETAAQAAAAGV
jgi:ComF family protein